MLKNNEICGLVKGEKGGATEVAIVVSFMPLQVTMRLNLRAIFKLLSSDNEQELSSFIENLADQIDNSTADPDISISNLDDSTANQNDTATNLDDTASDLLYFYKSRKCHIREDNLLEN